MCRDAWLILGAMNMCILKFVVQVFLRIWGGQILTPETDYFSRLVSILILGVGRNEASRWLRTLLSTRKEKKKVEMESERAREKIQWHKQAPKRRRWIGENIVISNTWCSLRQRLNNIFPSTPKVSFSPFIPSFILLQPLPLPFSLFLSLSSFLFGVTT